MTESEKRFRFPIRIYDTGDLEKEEAVGDQLPSTRYHSTYIRIPWDEIHAWHESYTRPYDIDDVKERGFNATHVITRTLGEYMCLWKVDRFEKEYDNHREKLDKNGDYREKDTRVQ